MTSKIGIIAGGGQFPLLFARAAKEQGREVVVVAHRGETMPELEQEVDCFHWVKLGQLGKIIKCFKQEDVSEAVLLGTITKTRIFKDVLPDIKGLTLWNKIDTRQDDAILRAVAGAIEKEGIRILESTVYLQHLLFPKGILTKKKPSEEQIDDIRFGWRIARSVGELDIGQCVVVRDRSVLAVEAIEGTDAAIKRGGILGSEKAVVVKVKKPNQDFRFDLPAIGRTTIDSMLEVKAKVLAVEAGQSLLFDREAVIRQADKAGIIILGIEEPQNGELAF
ncbi:MAG: UDP-2,3-diacylglucosamine diphosphatase LpxI [Proteobacteria bacterium]|nr:UDP-2,3-diacylglucosamine diphosphatase LpxI [Pseudomonadota bacterium]MBU1711109.1 UDP-2,3-diacylglucosamine diphosphatase LpxI [Pseudomonadota bacterium]